MLRAFLNDDGKGLREIGVSSLAEAWKLRSEGALWLEIENPGTEEEKDLVAVCGFHHLAVEDALSAEQAPKVEDFEEHLFLVFRGLRGGSGLPVEEYKLAAFLLEGTLVTVHRRPVAAVASVAAACLARDVPWERSADRLLHACVDRMTDELLPVLESFDERYEELEESIFEDPTPETLQSLLQIKRDLFHVRRLLQPQREVLARLGRLDLPWIEPKTAVYFRDVYDHTVRAEELAVTLTDLVAQTAEAYLSVVSNRLNEVMKVLTIFSAILMPLTFLVGVYGMNLKGMPELNWPWFYPALWAVMLGIAGGLLVLFRKMKWL